MTAYRAIKQEMMQRIRRRQYPSGAVIPGEIDLAAEFNVARATVNRALRELSEEGILERKRHSGTRVAASPIRHAKLEIPLIRNEIEATGATYGYRLIEREVAAAPEWLAARLSLSTVQILHLRCQHSASGNPHLFEDRWINLAAVPAAFDADFERHNPNEWLVNAVPFTDAEFAFSAVTLDAVHAKFLGARTGEASFVAERVTWLDHNAITLARMIHRPGYVMVSRV